MPNAIEENTSDQHKYSCNDSKYKKQNKTKLLAMYVCCTTYIYQIQVLLLAHLKPVKRCGNSIPK